MALLPVARAGPLHDIFTVVMFQGLVRNDLALRSSAEKAPSRVTPTRCNLSRTKGVILVPQRLDRLPYQVREPGLVFWEPIGLFLAETYSASVALRVASHNYRRHSSSIRKCKFSHDVKVDHSRGTDIKKKEKDARIGRDF